MISVDVIVHALGDTPDVRQTIFVGESQYEAISPDSFDRRAVFGVSFEEAAARLAELPRLFFEPDGSFVWVGDKGWQIDGQLADRDGCVTSVQVKGACPAEEIEPLLGVFGWPQTEVVFELRQAGVFLAETEFCRLSGWSPHKKQA